VDGAVVPPRCAAAWQLWLGGGPDCLLCVLVLSLAFRTDTMVMVRKYPVTGPGSQVPIGWVTITAARAAMCNGCLCCYCGHKKSASYVPCTVRDTAVVVTRAALRVALTLCSLLLWLRIEIDHGHALPFNDRAHLMSAAILADDGFRPFVGCCANDP
jgi:hypothetical protein